MAPWSVMSLHQPASTVSMVLLYWPIAIRAMDTWERQRGGGGGEGWRGGRETGKGVSLASFSHTNVAASASQRDMQKICMKPGQVI